MTHEFQPRKVNAGTVNQINGKGYQLRLENSPEKNYSLAQIDDYMHLPRHKFPHTSPVKLTLEAKLSDKYTSGTWGFGLWNDPFGIGFGAGGVSRLLPVLPNAAWFFFGSKENFLSLRDDQPGSDFHVKTYRSPLLPSFTSLLALPFIPLFFWRMTGRLIRKLGRLFVKEDGEKLDVDVEVWHKYCLNLKASWASFLVDDALLFKTSTVPRGRLGIVIWIDNQYFCFDKSGKLDYGYLDVSDQQLMEIRSLLVQKESLDVKEN